MTVRQPIADLLRLPVLSEESASDHLLRLFEIEDRVWSRERLKNIGVKTGELLVGKWEDVLPRFTTVDLSRLKATTPIVHSKKKVTTAAGVIHRDEWSTLARRWCPACFAADLEDESIEGRHADWRVHRRWWWGLISIRTCPDHGVRIEDRCPTCGVEISWEGGSLTTCRNDHSLLVCEPVTVPEEDYAADAWFLARMRGRDRRSVPLLDDVDVTEALRTMETIGAAATGGAYGAFAKIDEKDRGAALSKGYSALADFPTSLKLVLDDLAAHPDIGLANWGIDRVYGYLSAWARDGREKPNRAAILEEVQKHYASMGFVRGNSAAAAFITEDAPIALVEAATRLKKGAAVVKNYLVAMDAVPEKTGKGTPVAVTKADFDRLEALFADTIEITEIGEILSIPKSSMRRLVAARVLPENAIHVKAGAVKGRFTRTEIVDWLEKLTEGVPAYEDVPAHLAPISRAGKGSVYGGIAGAVEMVTNGRAPVAGRHVKASGLEAVLIDSALFDRVFLGMGADDIDIHEAATLLDLHEETVWAAVHVGLLWARWVTTQRAVFSRKSIVAFKAKTIGTSEIAASIGTIPTHLGSVLTASGVKPILSPEIHPRARSSLYNRREIPRDLKERYRKAYGR